jgi:hypothetical protein
MSPSQAPQDALAAAHRGENFTGTIELGGHAFDRCHFRDAILVYSGGPVALEACTFTNVSFIMRGPALEAMRFLATMHRIGFSQMVDTMFHRIRTGQLRDEPY